MSEQDKRFMMEFSAVLGALVVAAIICYILASAVAGANVVRDEAGLQVLVARGQAVTAESRIQPTGRVVMAGSAEAEAEAENQQLAATNTQQENASAAQTSPAITSLEGVDLAQGEQIYKNACFVCHDSGAGNAPKIGDSAAWQPRIAQGDALLIDHAINGLQNVGVMMAKGGRADLSDAEVVAAVAYMVEKSK